MFISTRSRYDFEGGNDKDSGRFSGGFGCCGTLREEKRQIGNYEVPMEEMPDSIEELQERKPKRKPKKQGGKDIT